MFRQIEFVLLSQLVSSDICLFLFKKKKVANLHLLYFARLIRLKSLYKDLINKVKDMPIDQISDQNY